MFRKTLSAKLASYIIIATFFLASVSSVLLIYSEYHQFKSNIYQSVHDILDSTHNTASEAIYKLDTSIAQTLVDGIVGNKYIIQSTLYDENMTVLATQKRASSDDVWRPLNLANETISSNVSIANQSAIGIHEIVLDMESNLAEFYQSAISIAVTKFIEIIATAMLVYLISVKLIARPVETLSRIVEKIPPGGKAPEISLTNQKDEIGLLAKNTVNFINESHAFAKELENKQKEGMVLEAKLRHSQKMDAIGQLAGGIAHDFNNIMTVILGNVTLSETYLKIMNQEKVSKSLEAIKESAERAAKLTKQLLIFSRKDLIKPNQVDIYSSIQSASKMIQQLVPETFQLDYKLSPVQPVYVDQSQVELILINLIVNAKDALQDTGTITIECSDQSLDQNFVNEHPTAKVGQYVLLTVADSGTGIKAEDLARIFEPFYTTK
ncbi:MAG: hypothetical protein DRQ47_03730, partial [Gammaproteobacteria bacterium]